MRIAPDLHSGGHFPAWAEDVIVVFRTAVGDGKKKWILGEWARCGGRRAASVA
jgi:hypothetical protein